MEQTGKLEKYFKKRNFSKTKEPKGGQKKGNQQPIFVIQKHNASSLHYDFRIEVDGVLKSWAVPKGPSTNPSIKRLALPTEDHPLEYADFEGVIPAGEYGAGTVIVWDKGAYRNMKADKVDGPKTMEEALKDGKLELWLEGEKIAGGYALIRTDKGKDPRWLLIKMDDEKADRRRNPTSTEPQSVISERTLEDVEEAEKDE